MIFRVQNYQNNKINWLSVACHILLILFVSRIILFVRLVPYNGHQTTIAETKPVRKTNCVCIVMSSHETTR